MIEAPTLSELSPELVKNTADATVRQIVEYDERIDSSRGAVYDVLAWVHSLLSSQNSTLLNTYLASRSLPIIRSDPDAADFDMTTDVVANFGIDRLPAIPARGEISIVRDTDTPVVIPVGSVFFSGSTRFITDNVYAARNDPADVITSTDRLITQIDTDSYLFTITVVCDTPGSVGMLRENASVTPEVVPTGFQDAYAASDFRNGRDSETNEDLIDRLEAGVARPSFASRPAMRAMLRDNEAVSNFVNDSTIGAGDAEMLRDKRFLVPFGIGGRVDWYVRTDESAVKTRIVVSAVLIEKLPAAAGVPQSVWRFTIGKDDAPALYEVISITPDDTAIVGSYSILNESRGMMLDDDAPDISNVIDSLYSRYQTVAVEFLDNVTDTSAMTAGTATQAYAVTVSTISRLEIIQDSYASNPGVNHPGADCLVRAPFPCWVSVDVALSRQETDPVPDISAVKDAIARVINRTGFTGHLFVSDIIAAAYSIIGSNAKVATASARGRLLTNDKQTLVFDSTTAIEIPYLPLQGVSHRTVQFFVDLESINVSDTISIPTTR